MSDSDMAARLMTPTWVATSETCAHCGGAVTAGVLASAVGAPPATIYSGPCPHCGVQIFVNWPALRPNAV